MEPCLAVPGIICNEKEAPHIIGALREYVDQAPTSENAEARQALMMAESVYSVQRGFYGEVFIRADAALIAKKQLEAETITEKAIRWAGYLSSINGAAIGTEPHLRTVREKFVIAHDIARMVRKSIASQARTSKVNFYN
jgi:hypothetical protein